jgi:hypothetical protein
MTSDGFGLFGCERGRDLKSPFHLTAGRTPEGARGRAEPDLATP